MFYRKLLLIFHAIEFTVFFILSIFVFILPSIHFSVEKKSENFDLFYKVIYVGILNLINDNYTNVGLLLMVLAFLGLFCFMFVHGMFKNFVYFNILYSVFVIIFFPIGTVISTASLYCMFMLNKNFDEVAREVRHQKLMKISIKKIKLKSIANINKSVQDSKEATIYELPVQSKVSKNTNVSGNVVKSRFQIGDESNLIKNKIVRKSSRTIKPEVSKKGLYTKLS